jgi:hypothetical protein
MKRALMAALVLGALVSPAAGDRADDDLAAVKKAVGATVAAEAKPPAEEPPAQAEKARADDERIRADDERPAKRHRSRRGEPQWIRVRIAEKGEKHGRVVVNLPLGLLRALDEDLDIQLDDHHGHRTLGEVLRALDSGQHLVDIDDDDATVHVWVE